jgi:hypothetical protein
MKLVAILSQKSLLSDLWGDKMTFLTGALIYVVGMAGFLMFFRHVRSCDDNMRETFSEMLAERRAGPKGSPIMHRAS